MTSGMHAGLSREEGREGHDRSRPTREGASLTAVEALRSTGPLVNTVWSAVGPLLKSLSFADLAPPNGSF